MTEFRYLCARGRVLVRYYVRVAAIKLKMYVGLAGVTIAGCLIKLAFFISPRVKKEMGYK